MNNSFVSNQGKALEAAIITSNLKLVERLIESSEPINPEELANARKLAESVVQARMTEDRTLFEKILMYVCGTVAILYTFNLIAYTMSTYLRTKMFEAHGLGPQQVYPVAAAVIAVTGALGFKGWYGPHSRLKKAVEIERQLSQLQ